ncbi:MAG: hypothetical protein HY055_17680 [Magnetospirillum sp.]|nr:hypothetical protein [Magnetospirillum sp.]
MTSPLVQFFWGEAARLGLLTLVVFAGLSLLTGMAMGLDLRRRPLLGLGAGLIHLIGASDLAYYLCWGLHLPLWSFGPLTALVLGLVVMLVSRPVFAGEGALGQDQPVSALFWPVVAGIAALIWLLFLMTPDPSEGFDEFQAWYPLYVEGSIRLGFFGTEDSIGLGHGLMASGGLYYQPNLLGLVALAGWAGWDHALFPAYMGVAALCSMAGLAVLAEGLRNSRVALLAFLALVLVFALWSDGFRLLELYVGYDHVLPLVGALVAATLSGSGRHGGRQAALLAGFLVFGRNYGALMGAVLYLVLAARDWRHGRFNMADWGRIAVTYVLFNAKEVGQALLYGAYFPRTPLAGGTAWNPVEILVDVFRHMGGLPHPELLSLPRLGAVPYGILVAAALAAGLLSRARPSLERMVWPALLLALPGVVEMVTGYTRGAFTKPYYAVVALYPWWPAYILGQGGLDFGLDRWVRRHRRAWLVGAGLAAAAIGILLVGRTSLGRLGVSGYAAHVLETYRQNNHSLQVARRLAELDPRLSAEVARRPVLYFYQEPGLGLRYFIGGNFFGDLDFYSVRVQKVLETAPSLEAALVELGSPSLYFSYDWQAYRSLWGNWTKEPLPESGWRKMEAVIPELPGQHWVKAVASYRYSHLVVLDEDALRAAAERP